MTHSKTSVEEREARVRSILSLAPLEYKLARSVLRKLEFLIGHPKVARMPGMLLYGDTNNGKSVIADKFLARYQPQDREGEECAFIPVVYVQAPPRGREAQLYLSILSVFNAPLKHTRRLDQLSYSMAVLARRLAVRMIIIDEVHTTFGGGIGKSARHFMDVLLWLTNELRIPIVLIGIQEAFNTFASEAQIINRFEPLHLERWKFGDEYRSLLLAFEEKINLEHPSKLYSESIAREIYAMSEGLIGEIARIIKACAIYAVSSGDERITLSTLKNIDFVQPTKRR